MALASNNPFPSVLIVEGTEPSAPSAGRQRVYIDSTSHHLKRTDSSGADVDIEAPAAASVSGLSEAIDDRADALITPGSGIEKTYDDGANTLTIARGALTINAQSGTSYTLVLADRSQFVTMTNGSASTFTVPPNSSVAFPTGTYIEVAQLGAGQVTLTPGAGVTINGTPGLKVAAQYGVVAVLKTATDTWLAMGRLSA